MSQKLYEENNIQNIALAIRQKTGSNKPLRASDMAAAILSIPEGSTSMDAENVYDSSLEKNQAEINAETRTEVDAIVSRIKSLTNIESVIDWQQGGIRSATGIITNNNTRICTQYLAVGNINEISAEPGFKFIISIYRNPAISGYVGPYKNGQWLTGTVSIDDIDKNYYIRVTLAYSDNSTIAPDDGDNLTVFCKTDASFTMPGAAANSKAVGEFKSAALKYVRKLTATESMADITEAGLYRYDSSTYPVDAPTMYSSFLINCASTGDNAPRLQIVAGQNGNIYTRYTNGTSPFTEWAEQATKGGLFYNATLYEYGIWTKGDINLETGASVGTRKITTDACRTTMTPLKQVLIHSDRSDIAVYACYYASNSTSSYIGYTRFNDLTKVIDIKDGANNYPTATYVRFVVKYKDGKDIGDFKGILRDVYAMIKSEDMYVHDSPRSSGVENLCKRANNLTNITYVLANDLPVQTNERIANNILPEGTTCVGIKYSSTREEQLFVPQAVSIQAFASAILNPNSYIYSRVSNSPNSKTYYGAVCSTFVAYCFNITDVIPTTISFWSYNGFVPLPDFMQNAYNVQVGYILNKKGSHIAVVTDVVRDISGKILSIGLSEASHPYMDMRYFTPEEVQQERFVDGGYIMYCYKYIDDIPDDDMSAYTLIDNTLYENGTVNRYLAPRRGDQANWRNGETVEIDVLDASSFTQYKLYDRVSDTVIGTWTIPGAIISLQNLNPGKYSLVLTDGATDSAPVFFTVMNSAENYSTSGNNVTVTYSSTLGTASAILFCNNNSGCSDYRAVRWFHVLTDEEISSGQCTIEKPEEADLEFQDEEYEAPNGVWKMRVMYKTEYGLFSSDIADVQF